MQPLELEQGQQNMKDSQMYFMQGIENEVTDIMIHAFQICW